MSALESLAASLELSDLQPVGGGSINDACKVRQADGQPAFLKTHCDPPPGFFTAEAAGLAALAEAGAPVPEVLSVGADHLLLALIETSRPTPDADARLGHILARLHQHHGPAFGFKEHNYCGTSPQTNDQHADGHEFFATCRLLPQGARAFDAGLLGRADMRRLERLCQALPDLIPHQPPSLVHGDLWSGNVIHDSTGQPVLIDPAVSWCWAEADLAMTRLFGGFGPAMLAAYQELSGLEPGFEDRVPLYNLYHLLNHLNLFGGGYSTSVTSVLRRFD
ncbi:MAG: fructosamine kinase family protein [Natronospirillum sp.]|uniref:fructosamine kinase family protein n=1 Tax=Natronospirillum sp. TaxID=2812955 RepID=UPI0025E5AEA5|nr:fructosamine kinase family protein [Natronospirillum sp.]MCH8551576.1 fructosamine kinase family protein [Natronospirillum sp.]